MTRWKFILLSFAFYLTALLFTAYSFTQVDLNLTLSSNSSYQSIQQRLTNIGYFNRPLSTIIFSSILASLSILYLLLIARCGKWRLTARQLWALLLGVSFMLTISYPAFAHDIFNYMFDTRTLVVYRENPWTSTPQNFPDDTWTRFMRWTHVSSAYPPGWLMTTIPFYLAGFGKFTLTLLSFKILGLMAFLASSWLILQLGGRKAWLLWSFNPMILIESLSSVHNDVVMVVFALLGFWLWQRRSSRFFPWVAIIWGGLIKYSSVLLLPFVRRPSVAAIAAWGGALAFFVVREINPWYILLPVAISFISQNKYLVSLSLISSLVVMYRYYPCVAIFSC